MKCTADRLIRTLFAVALGAFCWLSGPDVRNVQYEHSRGEQLFFGEVSLGARIVGDLTLPVAASRCANCHADREEHTRSSTSGNAGTLGPPLTRARLTQSTARRGGPPSSYDLPAFCALLRTGVDPRNVIVRRLMPRYEIDVRDCGALWDFLTERSTG
jgi:hypothetical protein